MKRVLVKKIITTVLVFFLGISILATSIAMENRALINAALGVSEYKTSGSVGTELYSSSYNSVGDVEVAASAVSEKVEAEGAVLLINNGVLPLSKGSKVSLFGLASVKPTYGGTGSGGTKSAVETDFKTGLEQAGLEVNSALYNWYAENYDTFKGSTAGLTGSGWKIGEAPWNSIVAGAGNSLETYRDAAVVILSRSGGEGGDLSRTGTTDAPDGNYLTLNDNEIELLTALKEMKESGVINAIVVLLNMANPIKCDFLRNADYSVDACLWTGSIGSSGANAIGNILTGNVSPSGRLVDTYYYLHEKNPAVYNSGDFSFANASSVTDGSEVAATYFSKYVVYQEGIYMGYRYAETRYEDIVIGTENAGNFDYADTICFPFGYGLSYTTFAYENLSVIYHEDTDTYETQVNVRNTGTVAGKEVVQLYTQQPYTDYDRQYGVEKSAVDLASFAKTGLLQPGESEIVTFSVPGNAFSSYDANGCATYIRDAGVHYIALGRNAHDAVNNILAAKKSSGVSVNESKMTDKGDASLVWSVNLSWDEQKYATSRTGYQITNQFEFVDINKYEGRGDNAVVYMSRSDWNGTVHFEPVALQMTERMYSDMQFSVSADGTPYPTFGSTDTHYQLIQLLQDENGEAITYDDPRWESLLNQLTWEETAELCLTGLRNTAGIASIGKPETLDHNGPAGLTQAYRTGKNGLASKNNDEKKRDNPISYPSNSIVAASFNTDLAYQVGDLMGEEALWAGYSGLYGYAVNLHRSPYSGRNYEYYAEDGYLSGKMAAASTKGIQQHGVYVYTKHLALNDQETNRSGLSTWANEQSVRELYLKPFAICIEEANGMCIMTSLNRIGAYWSSASAELCKKFLRNECGLQGFIITDMYNEGYMDRGTMLLAGTNLPDNNGSISALDSYRTNHGEVALAMRESAHRILYTVLHSNAMNGYQAETTTTSVTPLWQILLYGVDVLLSLLLLACIGWIALDVYNVKKRKE